jgi:tetratricopeptide (TPR) repeat protein
VSDISEISIEIPPLQQFGAHLSVLVIESQSDVRMIITQFLQKKGFTQVRSVRDAITGMQEMRAKPADILIISNALEGPSVKDFIHEIREDKCIEKRAVILLSSPLNKSDVLQIIDLGFDAIIVKPVVLNEVLTKMKSAHENYASQKNLERIFELAKQEVRNDRPEKAEAVYLALAKLKDSMARPFVGLSRIAVEQNRVAEAIDLVRIAIARNENYAHAHSLLGELMLKEGDLMGAVSSFKKAVELSPLNFFRYEAITKDLMEQGFFDDAISILEVGFQAKLDHPLIAERLGKCYFAKKEYVNAAKYLRLAVEKDPDNNSFLNSLAICYRDGAQYDRALEVYNSILKRENDNHAVLFNKALLLSMMNRKDDALKLLKRVLVLQPEFKKAKDKIMEWGGALE